MYNVLSNMLFRSETMKRPIVNALIALALVLLVGSAAQAIDPPHNYSCSTCHTVHRDLGTKGTNNVCLACHKPGSGYGGAAIKSFTLGDMANPFGSYTGTLPAGATQSSHNWSAPDNYPAAGAQPPTSTLMNNPSSITKVVACNRCHAIHANANDPNRSRPFLRAKNDEDQMCLDCHKPRNTRNHMTGTHPINFTYTSATSKAKLKPSEYNSAPVNANPDNPTSAMKLINGKVLCSTCHGFHYTDSNSGTFDNRSSSVLGNLSTSSGMLLRTDMLGATTASVNICTNCHNKPNHSAAKNIQCADCHAGHVDYDPNAVTAQEKIPNVYMLRRYTNYSGGVKLTAVGKESAYRRKVFYQYTAKSRNNVTATSTSICQACHTVPPPGDTNDFKHGSNDLAVCNECHNHAGGYTAPTNNLVCGKCHGMPPIRNIWGTYSSTVGGYAVYSSTVSPNKVPGSSIVYSYRYDPYNTQRAVFKSEYSTAHRRHSNGGNSNDTVNYGFACLECHYDISKSAYKAANHKQRTFQNVFVNVSTAIAATSPQAQISSAAGPGSRPKYDKAGVGNCNSNYCHSNGNPRPSLSRYSSLSINWSKWAYSAATPDKKRLTCNTCHRTGNNLTTNAHSKHVNTVTGKSYSCAVCHNTTVVFTSTFANNTTIILTKDGGGKTTTPHVNGAKDVAFNTGTPGNGTTWTTANAQCSTSYCHSNGKGTYASPAPDWTSAASGACGTCHATTPAIGGTLISSNAHFTHFSSGATYGPKLTQATVAGCQNCHDYNSTQPDAKHVNSIVEVGGGASQCAACHPGTLPPWTDSARLACTSCHAASPSVIKGVSAPYKANFAVKGHGQYTGSNQCNNCHNANKPHIDGVLGSAEKRLTLANDNELCKSCHNDSFVPAIAVGRKNMVTHVTSPEYRTASGTMTCKTCHDTHGTTNIRMIRTTFNGKTIVFNNRSTGYISKVAANGFYNGLCQVCHTKTTAFRNTTTSAATGPSGHYADRNCWDCHTHNGEPIAFKPSGGGACNGCHGYPPVQSMAGKGIAGNYSSAKVQDYVGGGGAHSVVGHIDPNATASQAWNVCSKCHLKANHGGTLGNPADVTVSPDAKYRFDGRRATGYKNASQVNAVNPPDNATGNCSNVSCHFQLAPRWSTER
jgi:predicted CxxxxCH...CXXCH cytochrome family protein